MNPVISETTDIATCLALRRTVFIDEQGVPEADELDAHDPIAVHFIAHQDGLPVGTARLLFSGNIGKIGRVCVVKSHRGTGLGAGLINAALGYLALEVGITAARLGAQASAVGFYENLGFAIIGPEYLDAGIAHFDMERPL